MELKVENLFFEKDGKEILKNLSFSLKSGEKAVLIGVNGSGKTTILKLLNALYFPTSGKITVDGEELGKKNFTKRFENSFRQKCVLLFQNYEAMFFCKNLYEEITFSPKRFGFENIDAIARKSAEKFGLTQKLDDFAFNLSGGERQRAALACIYALSPSLALLTSRQARLIPLGALSWRSFWAKARRLRWSLPTIYRLQASLEIEP